MTSPVDRPSVTQRGPPMRRSTWSRLRLFVLPLPRSQRLARRGDASRRPAFDPRCLPPSRRSCQGQVRLACCRGLRLAFQPLMTSAHSRPVFAPNKNTTTPHSHTSHCALRNESINSPAARATKSGCAAVREPLRLVRLAMRLVLVTGVASRRAQLARARTRCASGHDLAACRR